LKFFYEQPHLDSLELVGKPAKAQSSTALGAFVSSGIKDIFDKFGIKPTGWF
jgi:alkaline phosphatase D